MPPPRRHSSNDEELVALVALGVLAEDEQRGVAAHLLDCDQCQTFLVQARQTLAWLCSATLEVEPSAGLKERLMQRAAEELQQSGFEPG